MESRERARQAGIVLTHPIRATSVAEAAAAALSSPVEDYSRVSISRPVPLLLLSGYFVTGGCSV